MAFSDTEVSPVGTLGSSLNDGFIALPERVLEVQKPEHQSDLQARATRCAVSVPTSWVVGPNRLSVP